MTTIAVRRSGGTGGLQMQWRVDTASLPAEQAGELEALLAQIDLAAMAATPPGVRADRFSYAIALDDAAAVELPGGALTHAARALVDRVQELGTPEPLTVDRRRR